MKFFAFSYKFIKFAPYFNHENVKSLYNIKVWKKLKD